jgi:hypothetical protein
MGSHARSWIEENILGAEMGAPYWIWILVGIILVIVLVRMLS